jgi:hypothetical protein
MRRGARRLDVEIVHRLPWLTWNLVLGNLVHDTDDRRGDAAPKTLRRGAKLWKRAWMKWRGRISRAEWERMRY